MPVSCESCPQLGCSVLEITSASLKVTVAEWGAYILEVQSQNREGEWGRVTLGYADRSEYLKDRRHLGSVAGRFANRIKDGIFKIDETAFTLEKNNGPNALHGGEEGFGRKMWTVSEVVKAEDGGSVTLTLSSPSGDQGYPGKLDVKLTYQVRGDRLHIKYEALSDAPTVVNLTNHSYFNLSEQHSVPITDHWLTLAADSFLPIDSTSIPLSGPPLDVGEAHGFDFRRRKKVGEHIDDFEEQQLKLAKGYDHNYVVSGELGSDDLGLDHLSFAARLDEPCSGRVLEVYTSEPGIQVYSSNFLEGTSQGKEGKPLSARDALCLETQHFPDSPNRPDYPSTLLLPGSPYCSETVYRFTYLMEPPSRRRTLEMMDAGA